MGGERPDQVPSPTGAVFLSYASEDAEAASRICESLRAIGITVWFDKDELRGGDVWDQQIRDRIHDCRLFIPVISANTERRDEGYFRREWGMAVERTRDMSEKRAFLLPVVIDDTHERVAAVPDKFRQVQWSRLSGGVTSQAFVHRIGALLGASMPQPTLSARTMPANPVSHRNRRPIWLACGVLAVLVAVSGGLLWYRGRGVKSAPPLISNVKTPSKAAFAPPSHSIAVLPFVNMSGDKEQEYFSEGLTEELLNSLARINELQVAARTSSFSFQGQHADITTVAHKLNVGAVLEGSVRRSTHTIRITTQLVNGATGFHLWSQTYDRDLGDVLALQTEIANAVANALKVTLLGDVAARVQAGGTRNPAAFDSYLKGSQAYRMYHEAKDLEPAIAAYTNAIHLDPNYALAYVGRSKVFDELANEWIGSMAAAIEPYAKAQADARKAVALAPDLGEGHLVFANALSAELTFARANEEYERALTLAPGNALVLQDYGLFAVLMGHTEQGLSAARRAVLLDPLNRNSHIALSSALLAARQYEEALSVLHDALALDANYVPYYAWQSDYMLGNYASVRALCENKPQYQDSHMCLAMTLDKLGRRAEAEVELAKYKAETSDDWYQYADIYAQWGDTTKALSSLEAALRIRHAALQWLKTDPFLDALRKEPRFQAIEHALNFPD